MNDEFKITDTSKMSEEQLELHNKYIMNYDIQNLICNDGHMISWWEYEHIENDGYIVELHQSNIDEDHFVFVNLDVLKNIVDKLENNTYNNIIDDLKLNNNYNKSKLNHNKNGIPVINSNGKTAREMLLEEKYGDFEQ